MEKALLESKRLLWRMYGLWHLLCFQTEGAGITRCVDRSDCSVAPEAHSRRCRLEALRLPGPTNFALQTILGTQIWDCGLEKFRGVSEPPERSVASATKPTRKGIAMKNKRLRRLVRFITENPNYYLCKDPGTLEAYLKRYIIDLRKEILAGAKNRVKLEERIESLEERLQKRKESLERSLRKNARIEDW